MKSLDDQVRLQVQRQGGRQVEGQVYGAVRAQAFYLFDQVNTQVLGLISTKVYDEVYYQSLRPSPP